MEEFLRVSSFNCRNIKSSIDNVRQLCDENDIIFLQETWLTFEELSMLKSVHADFYADGVTAMDTSSGLLLGRPFGGIAILWRKSIGDCIQIHKYSRTPLIRPPSESHWCGRIRGMVAREGFVYEQKPLNVTRNLVV